MRLLCCGLLFVLGTGTSGSPQPGDTLASVHRAGKAVAIAAQEDLLKTRPRSTFRRALSALTHEIKVAKALAAGPAEKNMLAEYEFAARKLEFAATNFETWAAMDERTSVTDELADAVPATRGGVEAKSEILGGLADERQRAMAEANLALSRARSALKDGKEHLARAERAYLDARPPAPEVLKPI